MFGNLKIKDLRRLRKILSTLIKYGFGYFVELIKLKHHLPLGERLKLRSKKQNLSPQILKKIMEDLGGTFVKLGQLLSLRPDLIPQEYCDELTKLQEQARPFSTDEAKKIIEKELKKPIKDIFEGFNEKPIASASVSQIYEAKLKSKKVVIKVQRPDIQETFETDIHLMHYLGGLLNSNYKLEIVDIKEIIDEFERYTRNELDFIKEAKNISNFYKNFKDVPDVDIPKVFWNQTTEKVLTIEKLEGKNVLKKSWKNNAERKKIASKIANIMFKQVFIDGFFHADPHPGNVFVSDNGRIILLDFGITGHLDESLKRKLTDLFIDLVKGDLEGISHSIVHLNMVDEEVNVEQLKEDIYDNLAEYYGISLDKIDVKTLFKKLIYIAKKDRIKLPSNFVLLGKSLVTTESLCYKIYPGFNIIKEAKPFMEKMAKKKAGVRKVIGTISNTTRIFKDLITYLPEHTGKFLSRVKEADENIKKIDTDMKVLTVEMDKSAKIISFSMLITALLIASSLAIKVGEPVILGLSAISITGFIASIFLVMILLVLMAEKRKN